MSSKGKTILCTEDIADPVLGLGQEKAEGGVETLEDETKQKDPTTIELIKENKSNMECLQVHKHEKQATLEDGKEQIAEIEKDRHVSSATIKKIEGSVKNPGASKPSEEQELTKELEKLQISSTIPAEKEDFETQESGQQIPEVNAGNQESRSCAETLEVVKKQERRHWFRFPLLSKEDKLQKNEEPKIKMAGKRAKPYGIYGTASVVMFICVCFILGGFFWRIGYAMAGYHEYFLNATACPTLNQSSNDTDANHHSVTNDSNEEF